MKFKTLQLWFMDPCRLWSWSTGKLQFSIVALHVWASGAFLDPLVIDRYDDKEWTARIWRSIQKSKQHTETPTKRWHGGPPTNLPWEHCSDGKARKHGWNNVVSNGWLAGSLRYSEESKCEGNLKKLSYFWILTISLQCWNLKYFSY